MSHASDGAFLVRSPASWHETFPAAQDTCCASGCTPTLIRRFAGIPGDIDQPPLNAHVIALHLGGAKRVRRTQGKRNWVHDVEPGSLTLMPAYQANRWQTEGPIDFAHLAISMGTIAQIVAEEFDREPTAWALRDTVGHVDPWLEQIFHALLTQTEQRRASRLRMDSLLIVFAASLIERHSTLSPQQSAAAPLMTPYSGGLAGWQLRRVVDYMHSHLQSDVALSVLAGLVGLSRAHFFRAFRRSTGQSPSKMLADLRARHAMQLLRTTPMSIDDVATSLGFANIKSFAAAFTKRTGISPRLFRADRG